MIMTKANSQKAAASTKAKAEKKSYTSIIILIVAGLIVILMLALAISARSCNCNTEPTTRPTPYGPHEPYYMYEDKPIIYLYPEEETELSVKLGAPEKIVVSYPKYNGEWKVLARPDGSLVDLNTGRNLYALYWEGSDYNVGVQEEGFVVRGEDSAAFLEEKLAELGLNEREAEEFIVYWLPKLEANNYNYIHFEGADELNEYMPLELSVQPDTTIRIAMSFKGLDAPIEVKEQKLSAPERKGFVLVEWGGHEIK